MGSSVEGEATRLRHRVQELEASIGVLQESESRLRTVLQALPFSVALVDKAGRITDGNRGPYGLPLEECLGKPLWSLLPSGEGGRLREALDRATTLRRALWHEAPRSGLEAGGEQQIFEHGIGPVVEEDQVTALVVASREVTHHRRIAQYLAHGERMDAIGRLADGVAREFNELVLTLTTQANLAMDGLAADDPRKEQILRLQEASRRAAELARGLRAIGASRTARVEQLDLNEVVDRFVSLVRRAMPDGVELDFIPGHQLGTITADPELLEQLLLNLSINARDAMPRGGRITIETENVLINGKYQESHPWAKPGRYVLLTVSDEGLGMLEEVRERAFEPFFTTKAPGRGAGLGLATVYGIVQLHRGMIHLYSELEKGTTLKIYLPAVSRRADSVGPKLEGAVTGGSETILVAEDQDDVRRLVTRLLSRVGYQVIGARNGAEAVQLFSDHVGEVSLVLMDVMMPTLGGREASERIRLLDPDARILFTSGSTERVLSRGGELSPLLEKPYEPDRLLRMVRRMLDE
jgi:two-component system, cell cycle sensor histidine kinase and response regulator CckA